MKIDISCVGLDLTQAFSDYVEEKIGSCSDFVKRFEEKGELNLFFKIARTTKHHIHGDVFTAEAMIQLPGKMVHAKSIGSDARAVVDELKDELKIELRKQKEKAVSKSKGRK
ncbi:MAG: ribosome-associated translation inhibitor RaiA [bacterium]|nr:ribosome-associated translation inhibitor RaiA [Candidatus Jorgensenbacteria bacterium]